MVKILILEISQLILDRANTNVNFIILCTFLCFQKPNSDEVNKLWLWSRERVRGDVMPLSGENW